MDVEASNIKVDIDADVGSSCRRQAQQETAEHFHGAQGSQRQKYWISHNQGVARNVVCLWFVAVTVFVIDFFEQRVAKSLEHRQFFPFFVRTQAFLPFVRC